MKEHRNKKHKPPGQHARADQSAQKTDHSQGHFADDPVSGLEDYHLADLPEQYRALERRTGWKSGIHMSLKAICMGACLLAGAAGLGSMYIMASDSGYQPVDQTYLALHQAPLYSSLNGRANGFMQAGQKVYIEETCIRNAKTWGKTPEDQWVVLDDRIYHYLIPEDELTIDNTRDGGRYLVLEESDCYFLPTTFGPSSGKVDTGSIVKIQETWMDEGCNIWGRMEENTWIEIFAGGQEQLRRLHDPSDLALEHQIHNSFLSAEDLGLNAELLNAHASLSASADPMAQIHSIGYASSPLACPQLHEHKSPQASSPGASAAAHSN